MGLPVRAALVQAVGGPFILDEVELDRPGAGELRVRVTASGICHTDLTYRAGAGRFPFPAVLGHEGAGVVEAVGEGVTDFEPGDAVVLSYYSCRACGTCERGHPAYCERGYAGNFSGARPDGSFPMRWRGAPIRSGFFHQSSFATQVLAHRHNAVKVDRAAPLELLAPLGCGFQTGAGAVLEAFRLQSGQTLAVFGVGAVGLAAVMAARVAGAASILAVDLDAGRLELARELGATDTFLATEPELTKTMLKRTRGGVDFALECVGLPQVLRQAFDVTRPLGTCGLLGLPSPEASEVTLSMTRLLYGKRLVGIIEGDADPKTFIPRMVALHAEGRFPLEKLSRPYDFEAINDAVHDMEARTAIKPVLRMHGGNTR
ncbi:NAD(P)-dependent alcohol dehydrogenase [Myxococcus sp. CA051A]|uniref:NAD(P)-dependent alcohol dehydrogenase n=1 Tax=unclassified Myxococcus TaxID=2648731 RepID=UPI00157B127C|nr:MULTISPECIES: NAD(P)-dependent alcohol dehydrogenase [unclassified Myxococcus]NTX09060.1 NAD(P)-dependent alcohol dehydrogenase [Myxococcus sp. CA040A]NTX41623.1 NAD(P)-dependent alcohol dehydrogenase [Myxococcus sp. CA033]NTX65834.1 NAD(P)-dependent alcohol dehydrogenase [Myxococcus sp. CA051A]